MAVYNQIDPLEDESHQIISSYFLGPKAENFEVFKENLLEILYAQRDARLDYFPRDGRFITEEVQASAAYRKSVRKLKNAVRQASYLLGKHSIPFWSPRYEGHMCMDMSMPALLGYFMTMLYNPNNVTLEVSPLTTVAEIATGNDLCQMFGYNIDPSNHKLPLAWGHIVSGGTVANLESMWVARNLKFYPLSIKSAMKEDGPLAFIAEEFKVETCKGETKLFADLDNWELLNLKPSTILAIPEQLRAEYHISQGFLESVMQEYGIQSTGKSRYEKEFGIGDMVYYLPNTRHYSWPKAGAVTGIGSANIRGVKVDHGARADIKDLRAKLQQSLDDKIAVYAVVAIIGSTEEGAVDPLREILKLRAEFQSKGLSFLVHGDGAWGGYFCTMLPAGYKPGDSVELPSERGSGAGFVPDATLKAETQEDLFMLREVDSITVDPHKAAYIPYPAGALCYRDGRLRYQVTWTAPVLSRGETNDTSVGVYGIEGSKPGASVMSTWFANRCIGLGPEGYGKLLSEVCWTCSRLSAEWAALSTKDDPFVVVPMNELPSELAADSTAGKVEEERQKIRDRILLKTNEQIVAEDESRPDHDKALALLRDMGSDLNINAFSTNWRYADGTLNTDVEEANDFNTRVIQRLSVDSPEDDPTKIPFYLTSTTFSHEEYADCVQHFKKRLGLFEDSEDLTVMRNVVMSPWPTDGNFISRLIHEFRLVLTEEVEVARKRNEVTAAKHEFLIQGTDNIFLVHFPMFRLERHRRQLILEADLPDEARKAYSEAKEKDPRSTFILRSSDDIELTALVNDKTPFPASIEKRDSTSGGIALCHTEITPKRIIKDRSLRGRFRDTSYPSRFAFYLYGSPESLNIDHILVNSPNIQLSAERINLQGVSVPADVLAEGAILFLDTVSERAMQPFHSSQGSMGDKLLTDQAFFFQSGQEFRVSVYRDTKAWSEPGPGILAVSSDGLIGRGTMRLSADAGRYIDSLMINKDPFEVRDGTEKFNAWKKVFDSIGKELD